ncbi:hypothetical protein Tco_0709037, partial [Tanacetum coccineum]
ETLHIALEEAKSKHIFEGVKVGLEKFDISYLQFVDDALILGKWSIDNAKNLCRILRCFNLAFRLKVKFSKSKLFGIGVSTTETNNLAYFLNCEPSKLPCSYLGLPIGANMSVASNWNPIIDKFHKRLTHWKVKTLSYGGKLTLLKSVLGALGCVLGPRALRAKVKEVFKKPKKVIVISSSDEYLSCDEEIVVMGDIPFSDTDEEQPQATSTSIYYRKISMTGCVLLPPCGCVISKHKEEVKEMKSSEVGNEVK